MTSQIPTETEIRRIYNRFGKICDNLSEVLKNNKMKKELLINEYSKNFNEIKLVFAEQQKLLEDLTEENNKLKKNSELKEVNNRKTFVEIAKQNIVNKNNEKMESKEVVLLFPNEKNQNITSDELKSQVKSRLDLKQIKNIGIINIRKIRNNGILIECNDKNECKKLSDNINNNLNELCTAKIPIKKNPRLIIYNLFNDNNSLENNEQNIQEIKDSIISQNEIIEKYLNNNNEKDLNCKYLIKSKNPKLEHLIIEVSPELRKILLGLNKLNIGWSRHSVKDFISITRCFKCLGFGHTKSNCSAEQHNCSNCGVSGHSYTQCTSDTNHKTCVNCKKFNNSLKDQNINKFDVKHDALYSSCPSLLRMKSLITSKINYD
jgi:hypothetical protein